MRFGSTPALFLAIALTLSSGAHAMAVKQALGPNTQITVYDDTHANAGGDGSYGLADVKAAMDILVPGQANVQELVGAVNGLPFSAGRKQYLLDQDLIWGGDNADGTMPTTWVDKNIDIFWRVGAPKYRIGAGPITTRLGTKIGVGPAGLVPATMAGLDGVNIFLLGPTAFRNDIYMYGCRIIAAGLLQILTTGGSVQEIAGNIFSFNGSTSVMGDSSVIGDWYNNLLIGLSAAGVWGTSKHHDEDGNIIGGPTPLQVLSLGAFGGSVRARRPRYVGAPTRVIQFTGADASDIKILSPITPSGVRLFNFSSDKTPAQGGQQWSTLNTRVGYGGTPLAGIPVQLESDIDGTVVDTTTFSDGDLGFNSNVSGYQNGVRIRDHYQTSGVELFRDRIYTLRVNEVASSLGDPRNPTYGSRRIVFKWAGQTTGFFRPMEIAVDLPLAVGPTANFGAGPGGGSTPLSVQFTDESLAGDQPITARAWGFGDGTVSSLQSPVHLYAAAGLYTVSLTVTTAVGSSTKTYVAMIHVQASPALTIVAPFFEEQDIAAMLEGAGQAISVGADTAEGLFTERDVVLRDDDGVELIAKVPVAVVQTSALPGLAIGAQLSTDGRIFRVWKVKQIDDGALSEASLQVV